MRALLLSNFYPPLDRGGYEQWCRDVAEALVEHGHRVTVLTTGGGGEPISSCQGGVEVSRLLHLEVVGGLMDTAQRIVRRRELERASLDGLRRTVATFQPDVALVWGMWNVPRAVPVLLEALMPGRVAFYLCDYWPTLPSAALQQWQAPARRPLLTAAKRLASTPLLLWLQHERALRPKLEQPICVSRRVGELLDQAGVLDGQPRVIRGGIRLEEVAAPDARSVGASKQSPLKLLYVGRLAPEKGVLTAIRALGLSARRGDVLELDVIGRGEPAYEAQLRAAVLQEGLQGRVMFRGAVPHDELPRIYAEHDALVFPSEWEEPFARTVLEAMAAGLVVVGTTTGGTGEVLVEGETGLTFRAGDTVGLADQLRRLRSDGSLFRRLAQTGQEWVRQQFTFERMLDEVEDALEGLTHGAVN